MGYENVEKDSLITLRSALRIAMKGLRHTDQMYKDMNFELGRIDTTLQ